MKNKIFPAALLLTSLLSFPAAAQDSLKTTTITVSNLQCNNDMPTIKRQLHNQQGIEEVSFTDIRGGQSVFTISYHSAATSQELVEQAIEATPGCDDQDSRPYKVKRVKKVKRKGNE
ncbi:MAG: hypothetical protein JNL13_03200 [Chitinophagaceae bacterium]|nr:hypothetical protein [Chitinophagaceae bacterium]